MSDYSETCLKVKYVVEGPRNSYFAKGYRTRRQLHTDLKCRKPEILERCIIMEGTQSLRNEAYDRRGRGYVSDFSHAIVFVYVCMCVLGCMSINKETCK